MAVHDRGRAVCSRRAMGLLKSISRINRGKLPGWSVTSVSHSKQGSIKSVKAVKRSDTISWERLLQIPAFSVSAWPTFRIGGHASSA